MASLVKGTLCKGASDCCSPGIPCGEEEGDCNSDLDCQEGLLCGHNNCPMKSGNDWDIADDCCYKPANGKYLSTRLFTERDKIQITFGFDDLNDYLFKYS